MGKKIVFLSLMLFSVSSYSIAQEVDIPYEFKEGQPARASEINANFRAIRDSINTLGQNVRALANDIESTKSMSVKNERLTRIESLITKLQNDIIGLQEKIKSLDHNRRDRVNDIYGVQELPDLTASVTKIVVSPTHDVSVFVKYESKVKNDFYVGLSGCSTDWRRKTYLLDDIGNIYTIKTASGIGYVGCRFINDPVFLRAGTTATFTLIFERPRAVEEFGKTFSLSIAQHSGTLNADGKWKKIHDFNVSIRDLSPNE